MHLPMDRYGAPTPRYKDTRVLLTRGDAIGPKGKLLDDANGFRLNHGLVRVDTKHDQ